VKKPYKELWDNRINIFNEALISLIFSFEVIINTWNVKDEIIEGFGWLFIILIIVSLVITWILTFPSVILEMLDKVKELFGMNRQVTNSENNDNNDEIEHSYEEKQNESRKCEKIITLREAKPEKMQSNPENFTEPSLKLEKKINY